MQPRVKHNTPREYASKTAFVLLALIVATVQISCGEESQFVGSEAKVAAAADLKKKAQDREDEAVGSMADARARIRKGQGKRPSEPLEIEVIERSRSEEILGLNIVRQFVSGKTIPGQLEVDVVNGTIDQNYTLEKERIQVLNTRDFTQESYAPIVETFTQGAAGASQMETFSQVQTAGVLDILIVIDDSGSMAKEQRNLAAKMEPLLSFISDSDWQVGIVTTDPKGTCLRSLIKKGDADAASAFKNGIEAGLGGSVDERGILTAARGLGFDVSGDGFTNCQTDWLRSNSTIAVLIVSDEDNCSNGDCGGVAWEYPKYLTDKLTVIRPQATDARVYGLFYIPGMACSTGLRQGNVYKALVDSTGGLSGSICDSDYSSTLNKISQDVASILKSQFALKSIPDTGSVKVFINSVLTTSGYTMSGKTITFTEPPPKDSQISVSYSTGATAIFADVMVQGPVAPNSVRAMINGVSVDQNSFTVDYAKKDIRFQTAPPDNAEIRISYKRLKALPKVYNIGTDAIPGSLGAKVGANAVEILTYSSVTGVLELKLAPEEASAVSITFKTEEVGQPILSFPLSTPWKSIKDLSARDADSGDAMKVRWENQTLFFDASEFVDGRHVVVTYRDQSTGSGREISLAVVPKGGKVLVEGVMTNGDRIICENLDVIVHGKVVSTQCDLGDADRIVYKFYYEVQLQKEFDMSEIKKPDLCTWKVWIDDSPVLDFVRKGSTIILPAKAPGGSLVKIEAKFDF